MTIFMIILIERLRSQRLLVKRMLELKMAVTPTSVRCSDSHLCCPISNISTTPTALFCISRITAASSTGSTTTSQFTTLLCSTFQTLCTLCTTQPTTVHIIKQHRTTFQEHKFPVCSSEKHFNIAQQFLTPSLWTGVDWAISL